MWVVDEGGCTWLSVDKWPSTDDTSSLSSSSSFVHLCYTFFQEMGVSIDNMQKWTQDATLRFTRRKAPPASVVLQQMKQQQQQAEEAPPQGPPPAAEAAMQQRQRTPSATAAPPAARAIATAAATAGAVPSDALEGARESAGEQMKERGDATEGAGGGGRPTPLIAVGQHWDADYDAAAELLMPWR